MGMSMQVADVHKALLSLSRCADMGFESRFGSACGCLIDTTTGEITRQFDLPSPADMVISANGRTIAMVLPNAVHYYNLRDASL